MKRTVMALYLDDNEPWIGHVEADTNEAAIEQAQLLAYSGYHLNEPERFPVLPLGYIPNVLRPLVVVEGHVGGEIVGQDFELPQDNSDASVKEYLLRNPFADKNDRLEMLLGSVPYGDDKAYIPAAVPGKLSVFIGFGRNLEPIQMVGLTRDGVDLRGDTSLVNCHRHTTILPYSELNEAAINWCLELLASRE